MSHTHTPSNTARKRQPASVHRSTPVPGHIAQMQALFQSAKASLRVDMAFAASPTGSIGSRLPPDNSPASQSGSEAGHNKTAKPATAKDWRYSTAPQLVAAAEQDVREPMPGASPTLPEPLLPNTDDSPVAFEPMSSGFASPVDHKGYSDHSEVELPPLPMSDAASDMPNDEFVAPLQSDELGFAHLDPRLEHSMSGLHVGSDSVQQYSNVKQHVESLPEHQTPSPRAAHRGSEEDENEFFLSENAKAAAESAKAKRGLLRSLFPWRWSRAKATDEETAVDTGHGPQVDQAMTKAEDYMPTAPVAARTAPHKHSSITPCPDPSLHKLLEIGQCPDPTAHFHHSPGMMGPRQDALTPEDAHGLANRSPSPCYHATGSPAGPFQRATATGSPMPFARARHAHRSPDAVYDPRRSDFHPSMGPRPPVPSYHRPGTRNGGYPHPPPVMESEHFRPGWYYARESLKPPKSKGPMDYSFSTAAAKEGGQSTAPDSEIRDSYRTDTLTTLAKPPSRFRKNGIGAVASARGVSRFYAEGDPAARPASRMTRTGTRRSHRYHDNVQFRSSPPRNAADMAPGLQKRRRPRDLEDEHIDIREDDIVDSEIAGSLACVEEGSEVMTIDEDTRAAVRLSLYGRDSPHVPHGPREGMKEISPNVTHKRKGMRQPRKKRRPSYWDGDLEQVRESPAAKVIPVPRQEVVQSLHQGAERQVMTTPAKEEIKSMKGEKARITPEDDLEMKEVEGGVEDEENGGDVGAEVDDDEIVESEAMEVDVEG